jgi:hypothetical protein
MAMCASPVSAKSLTKPLLVMGAILALHSRRCGRALTVTGHYGGSASVAASFRARRTTRTAPEFIEAFLNGRLMNLPKVSLTQEVLAAPKRLKRRLLACRASAQPIRQPGDYPGLDLLAEVEARLTLKKICRPSNEMVRSA